MKKNVKILLVILMSAILLILSTQVFAATNDYIDLSNTVDLTDDNALTNNTPINNVTTNNTPVNNVANNSSYNTNLPKTGATETGIMGISITLFAIVAIYAYKKVREYKNI